MSRKTGRKIRITGTVIAGGGLFAIGVIILVPPIITGKLVSATTFGYVAEVCVPLVIIGLIIMVIGGEIADREDSSPSDVRQPLLFNPREQNPKEGNPEEQNPKEGNPAMKVLI